MLVHGALTVTTFFFINVKIYVIDFSNSGNLFMAVFRPFPLLSL